MMVDKQESIISKEGERETDGRTKFQRIHMDLFRGRRLDLQCILTYVYVTDVGQVAGDTYIM